MFQTTRRRLALWYTTVTAILLLLFATTVYLYVRNTLIERVDDTLNHVVEVVERSLILEEVAESYIPYQVNVEASFHNNSKAVEDDHIDLEWFSPTGKLLWSTLSTPLDIPLNPNQPGETIHLSADQLLRQLTKRVETGRYVLGYLRVSHPWFEVTKPSQKLIWDLTIGISLMIVSVAGIGWFLSGLAMKPVRESYQRLKQFTADASHELRNPIATIQTTVQVALADPDLDQQWQRQQLKVVERLTQRLGRLVNDLLFLARVDSGMVQPEWQNIHLDDLLMEVIEEQQLIADKKGILLSLYLVELANSSRGLKSDLIESSLRETNDIFIDRKSEVSDYPKPNSQSQIPNLKLDEDIFTIQGDWNQLARLFTNLVSNGVQYTPPSDRGSVQVELQRIDPLSKGGGRHKQSLLRVEVRDNGIGISESGLPHIFDRFYRVDPARPHDTTAGSGLGLAIAKAIVENHHGQIQVDSIIDKGTTVTVILPNSVI
ncbi:sensor histidine kinase [Limnofasciculus baicalensis]|uniref:histidine kinase n=1 Tax=Limnofasciculus baicalensis BBK-W-15 TaxID=2699891 RepID=A0AAE3KMV5_9CYAN|nr:ATP-binding protein [Limnofasciculus baicalensis]MCP2729181.1 ATP-binding protein [Limnofasciculus baicalensis BBK-W-15]